MPLIPFHDRSPEGQRIFYFVDDGTGVPTAACGISFDVGDEVHNINPTAASPYKWRCIVAGDPGTWSPIYGARVPNKIVTAATTFNALTDKHITVNTAGGVLAITLPDPTTCSGAIASVSRSGANNATISAGAGLINGLTTVTLGSDGAGITLQSDGTTWRAIGSFGTVTIA